jgi:hypothetical protein
LRPLPGASLWAIAGALSLGLACATTKIAGTAAPSIEQATLTVGARQYRLAACGSGDLAHFLGVDLADEARVAFVRLVIDPIDGPRVRVALGEGLKETFVLDGDQCRQLEASVKPTDWQVNTVRDVSGYVDAECRSDGGQAVSLHARFSHCH